MRRIVTIGAVLAVLVAGALVLLGHGSGSGPTTQTIGALSPAACFRGTHAQEVDFSAGGGTPLYGALLGAGDVGVVLAHQAEANMCQWLDEAQLLAERGYRVLAFNFSFDGAATSDAASVVAAAKTLRTLGAKKIVLMGASRGGAAVLAAAGSTKVDAVIALSPPAEYNGSDALAGVEASRAPLLIAVGELDSEFAPDAIQLDRVAKAPSKRLIVKKGSAEHGVLLLEFGGHSVVDDAVLKLLASV